MQNLAKRGWTDCANESLPAVGGWSFWPAITSPADSVRETSPTATMAADRAGMTRTARRPRVMSGSGGQAGTIEFNPGRNAGFCIQRVGAGLRPNKADGTESSETSRIGFECSGPSGGSHSGEFRLVVISLLCSHLLHGLLGLVANGQLHVRDRPVQRRQGVLGIRPQRRELLDNGNPHVSVLVGEELVGEHLDVVLEVAPERVP